MCNRLSLLSQRLQLEPKGIDLNKLITRTIDGMNGQFVGKVVKNLGDLPIFMLDDEQMQKVLLNLLINANEAVREGGQITLTTSCDQGWAEICVSDNGCGMSLEFMDKYLFKPFQTTKPQGMGVGLFHCKTIVEAHGGKIEVESEEGGGTTFRVLLPVGQRRV
jgi:signal transduction histidine kinase